MVDQHTALSTARDHDVDIHDKTLIDRRVAPYKFELSVRTDSHIGRSRPRVSFRLRR